MIALERKHAPPPICAGRPLGPPGPAGWHKGFTSQFLMLHTHNGQESSLLGDLPLNLKVKMFHAVIITLVLTRRSVPLPTPQGGAGSIALKQEIHDDTLTHKMHTSDEFLIPSNHGERTATPLTDIFCIITVPITDIINLIAGLAPQPCETLYQS